RLPLQPAQRWLGARWATIQQAGAAGRRWVAARADELPLAEIKAGLSAAWAAGRRWAGPRVHTLRLGLAQRAAVVAGWPAVAAARRLVDEGRRRWQTWLRQPRLLRYLVLADSALAGSIVVILTVTAPALQAAGPSLPAELRAGLPRGAARVGLAVPAAPLPTATPPPTPAPTATPEPVLTATPIPNFYTEWESWLPTQGGWNGLGECWGNVLAPAGAGRFVWPTDKRYLVGKDYNWRWHPGLDLGGDVGDPIYAADSGVVVYAGWNVYGFGNLVIVDHGNNWHTLYAHLSEILVTCGEGVEQGALLGLAGSTGHSTGPHLHFEIRSGGVNVNPWDYLPAP
ncbi:MAG: M23 family metallopeptidase, partial [Anaerolineales bacterium]|nr:M23 family metallopeptidase [Anaerolineales bacterium]